MDITINVDDYKLNVRAACIITHNNKILLHKNYNESYYALLGGRIKIGESSEDAIKREVKEELGKEIEITGAISIIENFFEIENSKYHEYMFVYKAEFKEDGDKNIEDTIKNIEGREELKYEWLDIKNIEQHSIKPNIIIDILKENKYPVHKINKEI